MPKWLICCAATVVAWGGWAVIYKAPVLQDVSAATTQVFSTAGIVPIMLVLLIVMAARPSINSAPSAAMPRARVMARGSLIAFVAGLLVALGNVAYYQALASGAKASTAVSLTALYPLTTVLLAMLILRERPSVWQMAGIAGSLAAIYLLSVSPSRTPLAAWIWFASGPILLWGVASLVMKQATADVSAERSTFWFLAAFLPLAVALVPLQRIDWNLSARQQALLALIGFSYGLGNLGLLAAFRLGGKASIVTPLTGLYPIVTIPLAVVLFGESLEARGQWGIAVALASAVLLTLEPPAAIPELAAHEPARVMETDTSS